MDRSPEQQKIHKELITRLKQSMKNHPEKYWYIKNGSICSRPKDIWDLEIDLEVELEHSILRRKRFLI